MYPRECKISETEVFRTWNRQAQTPAAARRRKLTAQAGRRRFDARQTDAAGRFEKKALRAKERRQLVKKLIDEYRMPVRRACRVCLTARSLLYFKLQGPRLENNEEEEREGCLICQI
jgi:hypothetical protein